MLAKLTMLHAARIVGGFTLTLGLVILSYSLFVSGSETMTGIAIGTVIGSIFIFLMGIFFVATEEMLEKSYRGIPIITKRNAKTGAPLSNSDQKYRLIITPNHRQ